VSHLILSVVARPEAIEVHVEVSDFGYGPAHAAIALLEEQPELNLTVWSSGNALELMKAALPQARFCRHDATRPGSFGTFAADVAPRARVLTMSRAFAAQAAQAGHWVCLVDQLDWMWGPQDPPAPNVALHLVPGFGSAPPTEGSIAVAPLLSSAFRGRVCERRDAVAVVGFGGMSMMGDSSAADGYARWLLGTALPVLAEDPSVMEIVVVGGSPSLAACLPDPMPGVAMSVRRAQTPERYARLLASSAHQILTPGLATLVECQALNLTPLLQPGVSKSMLLQLDAVRRTGYEWTAPWPWHADAVDVLVGRPQAGGLAWLAPRMRRATAATSPVGWLVAALRGYLQRPGDANALELTTPGGLPDAGSLLSRALAEDLCA
jgi:hypothetical protein